MMKVTESALRTQAELASALASGSMKSVQVYTQERMNQVIADGNHPVCDGNTHFTVRGAAVVSLKGNCTVTAYESSYIMAYGSVEVRAYDSSTVLVFGQNHVAAYGHALVISPENADVWAYGDSTRLTHDLCG